MLRRQDLIYLVDKWTRYEKNIPLSDSKVKEVVQSFVEDVEQILTMDDKEEQEAFDKMFESLSPEEYKKFCEEYEADEALMAELEL